MTSLMRKYGERQVFNFLMVSMLGKFAKKNFIFLLRTVAKNFILWSGGRHIYIQKKSDHKLFENLLCAEKESPFNF